MSPIVHVHPRNVMTAATGGTRESVSSHARDILAMAECHICRPKVREVLVELLNDRRCPVRHREKGGYGDFRCERNNGHDGDHRAQAAISWA